MSTFRKASPELQSWYRAKRISRFKFLLCETEVSKMICLRFLQEFILCAFWNRGNSTISMPIS